MGNCKSECNKQLQGLAARLAHAEDNITNHFMGVSTLVEQLAANPLTAFSVVDLVSIYNSLPSGMELLQLLKDALPNSDAITMKKLMLKASEAMLDTIAGLMDSVGGIMIAEASAAVAAAEAAVVSAEDTLATAILVGTQGQIDLATAALALAKNSALSSKSSLETVAGFMTSQANISKCKTKNIFFGS